MTIHDERTRHRRLRYHERIQTQALTYHLSLAEKDLGASHRRYQKKECEKRDLRIPENTIETLQKIN